MKTGQYLCWAQLWLQVQERSGADAAVTARLVCPSEGSPALPSPVPMPTEHCAHD